MHTGGKPKQLYKGLVDTTPETVYTTPTGGRTIVRHIHYNNPTAGAVNLTIALGTDTLANKIFDAYVVAAGTTLDHFCYYVLETTVIITAYASADDTTSLVITGEEVYLL